MSVDFEHRLSDTAESRRLRAMLTAVEDCDGVVMVRLSVDASDGLVVILTMPRGEDETVAREVVVNAAIAMTSVVSTSFVQLVKAEHPQVFEACWPVAIAATARAFKTEDGS